MKNILFTAALALGLGSGPVMADSNTEAAIGGGLGGVLGAVIGNEVAGSTGAIVGAGVGGAAGAVIANRNNREPDYRYTRRGDDRRYWDDRRYRDDRRGDSRDDKHRRGYNQYTHGHRNGYFCPPGQGKKGRC